jgi:hypothetical protein
VFQGVVYYESRKRELKIRLMNEGRCDERLKARVEESTSLTYTGLHDKTNRKLVPRDKDEVNKREIHGCDGRAHDPVTMVAPLTPKPTRKAEASPGRRRPLSHVIQDVYYESMKRKLKIKPNSYTVYECRCNGRLHF